MTCCTNKKQTLLIKQLLKVLVLDLLLNSISAYTFSYTTNNPSSYMCPAGTQVAQANIACAQTSIVTPGVTVKNTETGLLNCGTSTIKCFLYATVGKSGGSCTGDPFKDDPSGVSGKTIAWMPESVMQQAIGKSSFQFSMTATEVNGVQGVLSDAASFTPKLKVLGLCSGEAVNAVFVSTADPNAPVPPTPSPNDPAYNATAGLLANGSVSNKAGNLCSKNQVWILLVLLFIGFLG